MADAIDIGAAAIDRSGTRSAGVTIVGLDNPANHNHSTT